MEAREIREGKGVTALHDTGALTCPRCGVSLTDLRGELGADDSGPTEQIRVDMECPSCDAPLAVLIESAAPEAIGVDVWVEDRHEVDKS